MNTNQYSQILKLVQLENDLNQINNKTQRLQAQYQQVKVKRERILQNLVQQGIDQQTVQAYYNQIKNNQIQ